MSCSISQISTCSAIGFEADLSADPSTILIVLLLVFITTSFLDFCCVYRCDRVELAEGACDFSDRAKRGGAFFGSVPGVCESMKFVIRVLRRINVVC